MNFADVPILSPTTDATAKSKFACGICKVESVDSIARFT